MAQLVHADAWSVCVFKRENESGREEEEANSQVRIFAESVDEEIARFPTHH